MADFFAKRMFLKTSGSIIRTVIIYGNLDLASWLSYCYRCVLKLSYFVFFLGLDIEWIFSFRHFLAKNCIFRDQKMAKILRLPNFSLQILLVSSPDYHRVVITFLRYGGACMWVNFNFHFQIKSLMLLCERS